MATALGATTTSQVIQTPESKNSIDYGEKIGATTEATEAVQRILKHSRNADEAMKAFAAGEIAELDEANNRRLLRIIDWHLMPLICAAYCINNLDKITLSYASIMGLKQDLHLVGDNYQWLGSVFYFGYLVWEYPTTRLLQRLPLAKYSAFCVIMWGITLALFGTVSNFRGAVVVRVFLGAFEAAITPGCALFTSQWYTKREQGTRTGIWFSFNGWAQIIGGPIAYGLAVGSRKHKLGIAPWRLLCIVYGVFTVCLGILFYLIIPDNQLSARWLKPADRILCVARIRSNQQGIGNKTFKVYQLKEALLDPISWAFFLFALIASIPNGGISNFFSQILVEFGYTAEQALLFGIPLGAIQVISVLLSCWFGDKLRRRLLVSCIGLIIAIVGMICIVTLPLHNGSGRLAAFYLVGTNTTSVVAVVSLISTNVAGYTKKTTIAALFFIGYCAGNIIGPQTFRPKDAPRFVPGEITITVCYVLLLLELIVLQFYYVAQNKNKAKIRAEPGYRKLENQEFLDLTDRENPDFVYSL